MRFTLKVKGAREQQRYLKKVYSLIKKGSPKTLHNVSLAGKNYAKAIAPKQSGALIKAIRFKTVKNEAWITSEQPDNPRSGKAIPYHVMMHFDQTKFPIITGDPHYMFTMFKWMKNVFPKQMSKMVHAAVEGTGYSRTEV